MPDRDIEVTGIDEVVRLLDEAPAYIFTYAQARALHAAAKVVSRELYVRTPIQVPWTGGISAPGALHAAQRTEVLIYNDRSGGEANVGFRGTSAAVAGWVEYGHILRGHRPDKKVLEASPVEPHPFMRPAADAAAEAAIDAYYTALEQALKEEYVTEEVAV